MRTTFTILGYHPLLHIIRDYLIVEMKMELVSPEDNPIFAVVGAHREGGFRYIQAALLALTALPKDTPVLLLSSHHVYSDRDDDLEVSEDKQMSEDRPALVSVFDQSADSAIFSLVMERAVISRQARWLILRVFDIYGKDIPSLVSEMVKDLKTTGVINITSPGYQTRSLLHLNDFLKAFELVIQRFLEGAGGVYNVGSTESISLQRLADSVWQMSGGKGDTPVSLRRPTDRLVWWSVPDITRLCAFINWKPEITIRKGLWLESGT